MISYSDAIEKVLSYLKKRERVRILNEYYKKKLGFPIELDIWEVGTEILDENNKIKNIKLNIVFYPDFPLVFPGIYLSKNDYKTIKYLPHLEEDRTICVFENESKPNSFLPEKVVEEAIRRAKNILEKGLKKLNLNDYNEEFEAYWDTSYSRKEIVNKTFLIINEKPLKQNFIFIILEKPVSGFNYIIHQNEENALSFKQYLKSIKNNYKEHKGHLISNIELFKFPPFKRTNKELFESIISQLDFGEVESFKDYFNYNNNPKLFLFSKLIQSEIRYFGWFHSSFNIINSNGYRQEKLNNIKKLSTTHANELINRISPQRYTSNRLIVRSTGKLEFFDSQKIVIAGLGAIGSNLLHLLNSMTDVEFRLIDSDNLKLENIGRHYLGFNYIKRRKTLAIKHFLMQSSPLQKILTREKSVVRVIENEPNFINECDYLFVAIGESNIELFIADAIRKSIIKIPTFFIWVEPYLLGGHCIYIPPNSDYSMYFKENDLFKYNIIEDYNNKFLSLKEAGCQTNYTPYSSNNIQLFLGALYVEISKIINSNVLNSRSFTWVGDKEIAKDMKIKLSDYSEQYLSNTLIENQNDKN